MIETIKRYNIYSDDVCYDDRNGEYCPLVIDEDKDGDWVKWEDIKDKMIKYSEEEIKKVFWEEFHKSGELWFNYLGDDKENESSTWSYWGDFLDSLKKNNKK